jgi:hypothetical protein
MRWIAIAGLVLCQDEKWERYYPIDVGYQWTYAVDGGTLTAKVTAKVKVKEFDCYVVEEDRKTGKIRYYFSVTGVGVLLHKVNDQVLEEPLTYLKFPLTKGQTWTIRTSAGKATCEVVAVDEEVKVEAGTFACVHVRTTSKDATSDQWFGKDAGPVKNESESKGKKKSATLKKLDKP